MTGKSYRLNVMTAAGQTVVELVRRAPGWIAVAWLPWLLGTILYIVASYIYLVELKAGWPREWLTLLLFAPLSALVAVAVLRTLLQGQRPSTRNLEVSQTVGLVTLILIAIGLADLVVDSAEKALIAGYVDYTIRNNLNDISETFTVGWMLIYAKWFFKSVIMAAAYGLVPITVHHGRVEVGLWLKICRRHFFRFLLLSLLFGAAFKKFSDLYGLVLKQFYEARIPDATLHPLNDFIVTAFLWLAPYAPIDMLADVLPPVAAGVIFGAILKLDQAESAEQ